MRPPRVCDALTVTEQELDSAETIATSREAHLYSDVRSRAPSPARLCTSTTLMLVRVLVPSSTAVFTNELERSDGPK